MDRSKLKRRTALLTAGLGTAVGMPGCGIAGSTVNGLTNNCCPDAGTGNPGCDPSCYGVAVNPPDGGDAGQVMGFFVPDGGDGGTDAGHVFGTVVATDGGDGG